VTVNEVLMKLGRWGFKLAAETPRDVLDAIHDYGHIAISTGRSDPRVSGDSLLRSARYVGVVRSRQLAEAGSGAETSLGGCGMAMWLGDEDKKGSVLENATTFASGSFTSTINALLPSSGAVVAGTLHSVTGAYSNTHIYQDPRTAIDYVCGFFSTDSSNPVEWRVNGDGTLDAGHVSDLYATTPMCAILRRGAGVDMKLRGLQGRASTTKDVEDFTTRVILLASGTGGSVATGSADIAPGLNPHKDIHGNTVKLTRMVSESATSSGNAASRAQLALNQFTAPRTALTLSTSDYDVKGDLVVGDAVWVWSPDVGLEDQNNEITHRGRRFNPVKLRLTEMTWPVVDGMSVAFRNRDGRWYDLTDYVKFESGQQTTLVVGGYNRSLINSGGEPVGSRPVPDTSVPAAPAFVTPFVQAVYQSQLTGITKAQVQVKWVKPTNTDGTLVLDGDHYEIQYRTGSTPIFPSTHGQMSAYTHGQLAAGTHAQPITYVAGPWQSAYASFDDTSQLIQELTPGVPYDVRIRAFDNASPPNVSDWSATTTIQTNGDTLAPSTPAPPTVAASRISVQITHTLGRSDGGEWNLEADLNHLEIHAQYTPSFFPDDTTRIGKLLATNGMMLGEIPAVGTFPVEFTDDVYIRVVAVDDAGNKSSPSVAAQSSVLLIDDAHISDLTVTKVTAGTITATWLNGGKIWSGVENGARIQLVPTGLEAYNSANQKTVDISAADGSVTVTGKLQTGFSGQRVLIEPNNAGGHAGMTMFDDTTTNHVTQEVFGGNFLLQARRNSDREHIGGRVFWDLTATGTGSAYYGYQNNVLGTDAFVQVGSDERLHFKGWVGGASNPGAFGRSAIIAGVNFNMGGSNTTYAFSYGATMIGNMAPVYGLRCATNQQVWHAIQSADQNGFSVAVSLANDWNGTQWTWVGVNQAANTVSISWHAIRTSAS
jgi:hypothetical protein